MPRQIFELDCFCDGNVENELWNAINKTDDNVKHMEAKPLGNNRYSVTFVCFIPEAELLEMIPNSIQIKGMYKL